MLDLEKAEEPEITLPTSLDRQKSKRVRKKKKSTSDLLTTPKPLTVWITTNCGKFFKRWEYQTNLPIFWEICMQIKKQELKPDMEQQTGSKLGKEYVKAVYCNSAYLTYIHNTSCKMLGWMKHKLDSRLLREISITTLMEESKEELQIHLMKVESEKTDLQLNIQKWKITASCPIT